ncbi:MAG: GNAT family N-acetyltransferase [Flavobacteriaceae bacterium]|nr:GNAT family N-acetyltransferase [Flavobacteriaceae bacterium]|tara:strand:+ start:1220 stop:1678 length:459 start_codon:yes stop_codon:yes gene_type:complete
MISFIVKKFTDLNTQELHDLYALRSQVFVVEQNCVYQDIDGNDIDAFHVLGLEKNILAAYARIIRNRNPNSDYIVIGRIVILKACRGKKFGHDLVKFCIETIEKNHPKEHIKISAQAHLEDFYKRHGFQKEGKSYFEDGIPHISMIKKSSNG